MHKGRIAFATAAQFTDPADMLIEFFALDRSNIAESVQVGYDRSFESRKAV